VKQHGPPLLERAYLSLLELYMSQGSAGVPRMLGLIEEMQAQGLPVPAMAGYRPRHIERRLLDPPPPALPAEDAPEPPEPSAISAEFPGGEEALLRG